MGLASSCRVGSGSIGRSRALPLLCAYKHRSVEMETSVSKLRVAKSLLFNRSSIYFLNSRHAATCAFDQRRNVSAVVGRQGRAKDRRDTDIINVYRRLLMILESQAIHTLGMGRIDQDERENTQQNTSADPRLEGLGKVIKDEYAVIREQYGQSCRHSFALFLKIF